MATNRRASLEILPSPGLARGPLDGEGVPSVVDAPTVSKFVLVLWAMMRTNVRDKKAPIYGSQTSDT